jgi:hypothetical protein
VLIIRSTEGDFKEFVPGRPGSNWEKDAKADRETATEGLGIRDRNAKQKRGLKG